MINGNDLKQLREAAGLTQTELAEKLSNGGYTKQVISLIENGHRNIGINLLNNWCIACGYEWGIWFKKIEPDGV